MSELEKRRHRACFSGHRPEKLTMNEVTLCAVLSDAIDRSINECFTTFISGMARGVDIVAAEIVLKKKKEGNSNLRLICALPHPDFEKRWSDEWQKRYHHVLLNADLVKTVSREFSIQSYQMRNEWMVKHSARVLAFFNGAKGGTRNTIQYAESQGIEVQQLL